MQELLSSSLNPVARSASALPVRDLSGAAREEVWPVRGFPGEVVEGVSRGLFRSGRSVLLIGDSGVGKSTFLEELARQVVAGEQAHLSGKRVLAVDCQRIPQSEGAAFFSALIQAAARERNVVWCLDNVGPVLAELPLIRSFIDVVRESQGGVVVTLTREQAVELVSREARWFRDGTRVTLEEPEEQATLNIVRQHAESLAEEFSLSISPEVVERTVSLTSHFLLSERHPAKAIRLLRQVCEDLQFDRQERGEVIQYVPLQRVIEALSERTGIPRDTLSGNAVQDDFAAILSASVVGQEPAIQEVARELRVIKSGLNEPGKPASVMLFAGMTGVGKTELAKRIAEVYSPSRRLQTYTMANFTEPHSVSGIIGVPPGYVGYEQGGRLINELNADPYSVFLLDEAEKAHPNVWKPFLNLFDEGWIVDQRGVKATADRAIFILTTNAGDRNIAQLTRSGKSTAEVTEQVKQTLAKVRHERSSQPVFPPAFLARIGRIVVFQPLDEQAMIGIAERVCTRMQRQWEQKRQTPLTFSQDAIESTGRKGHELNQQAHGREGGRIIRKLIAEELERQVFRSPEEALPS